MNNEELCERVLPYKDLDAAPIHMNGEEASAFLYGYSTARDLIANALTQGILIPAENLLSVEEIRLAVLSGFRESEKLINPLDRLTYGDECHVRALVEQAIVQSSRQKAGV